MSPDCLNVFCVYFFNFLLKNDTHAEKGTDPVCASEWIFTLNTIEKTMRQ